ncbi:MAG: collagen binding domain-containing protein, partial [Faecousia sp.]
KSIEIKDHQTYELEFFNQPKGGLVILKKDSVTGEPLEGVTFKITTATGEFVADENGKISSNGLYYTDKNGQIVINGLVGTFVVTEEKTIEGYTIDENTRTQTVVIDPNDVQTLIFYNTPSGGLQLIKTDEDSGDRVGNCTFEIRRMDDGLVGTYTTDKNGTFSVCLDAGSYYAVEIKAASGYQRDDTPHYFEIEDGKNTVLRVTNKKFSGIIIHKIDSVTGEGIYDVKFLLYDANKNPLGEYSTDNEGYIYIDAIPGGTSGRFYIRELEAAEGYELDKEYKTVYVRPGETIEIEWENVPITGQIQIYKYAAEYNAVTGTAAGTPLAGAVYEIVNERSGAVVDYITTDARGVAASKPLPMGRYKIVEVTAPAYWQVDSTVHDVTLEFAGQIIKLSAYDKPANLGVRITKRGNAEVLAGSSMRYDITIANTSNVDLENFYWHDRIPTDAARATVLTTGTYSARLNYRILYKTNYNSTYQVLASNLLTSSNYSFSLNAIPMQAGEYVTDVYFDFGKVPVGFQSVVGPTLTVVVNGTAVNGYQLANRADVGGKYQGTWQTAQASWVTIVRRLWNTPDLPKTGY